MAILHIRVARSCKQLLDSQLGISTEQRWRSGVRLQQVLYLRSKEKPKGNASMPPNKKVEKFKHFLYHKNSRYVYLKKILIVNIVLMKGLLLVYVSCEFALNRYQSIPTVDEKDKQDFKKTNK